jgi:hypothetical protein
VGERVEGKYKRGRRGVEDKRKRYRTWQGKKKKYKKIYIKELSLMKWTNQNRGFLIYNRYIDKIKEIYKIEDSI